MLVERVTEVTATRFVIPSAWRSPGDATSECDMSYADLTRALGTLAGDAAELDTVLLAAHLKVLSMLTDDPASHTDVGWATGDRTARRIAVGVSAGTWQEMVRQVRRAAWTANAVADSDDLSPVDDAVLFEMADGEVRQPEDPLPARTGYGLHVVNSDGRLLLRAQRGAVAPHFLSRLASTYRSVLEAMADAHDGDPRCAYLPADDRRRVLGEWAVGDCVDRAGTTVVELIRAQVQRTPRAPAVRLPGGTFLTYGELDGRSDQIARYLIGHGAGQDAPVAVCLRRGADLLPVLLGVWKSGAGYLPLDVDLPAERLRTMIDRTGCRLVVTTTPHRPALGALHGCRPVLLDQERATIEALPATPPGVRLDPGFLAYVIYTSGSTGTPKGVMVQHDSLLNYLLWTVDAYAAHGSGGSPFFASLSFDLGIPGLYTPLLTGQPVHLLPDPLATADLGDVLAGGAPYSFIKMTPGHLNLLSLDLPPEQIHRLAGIVVAAGDAFPTELATRWIRQAGPGGTAVATEYGPTEITIGNSGQLITDPPATELIPLGAPIPNTSMFVLNDELEPVPVGVAGEIYIGGAGVARGYFGDPALTADRFQPDPYGSAGSRVYRTGDRGRWRPGGTLEFLGRVDHQVKIRGYRVELGEIRAALRRSPQVRDAIVVPHQERGRARGLVAFVIPMTELRMDFEQIRAELARSLPEYMVPTDFVAIDDIPLTANGKVDARMLLSRRRQST
jgi:amino acid adenylation domain-containing protein